MAQLSEKLLLDRSQLQNQDGQRNPNARQAAEALFAPKQVTPKQSCRDIPASSDERVRSPRVLPISRTLSGPSLVEVKGPISSEQRMPPKISRSQLSRIRVWRRYGMSAEQVAEMYGVAVDEIERILR
jgi:hypothetical protein